MKDEPALVRFSTGYPLTYPQPDPDRQRWWHSRRVWLSDQMPLFAAFVDQGEDWALMYPVRGAGRRRSH